MKFRACSLRDLETKGRMLVTHRGRTIVLIYHNGKVYALDNRCPHMGFPLVKGSVSNGILTCDWHHARFDLESGCTLDLWADDAIRHEVEVEGGDVWVIINEGKEDEGRIIERLRRGLEHGITLLTAKALTSAIYGGIKLDLIYVEALKWYVSRRLSWGGGGVFLSAIKNLEGLMDKENLLMGILRALNIMSGEARERPPHPAISPLKGGPPSYERVKSWLRWLAEVRDEDALDRLLVSMVKWGYPISKIEEAFFEAATDHYLSDGHSVDFANKAFELARSLGSLDINMMRSLVPLLSNASRYEEEHEWRHPIDLVSIVEEESGKLAEVFTVEGEPTDPHNVSQLVLKNEPRSIARSITRLLENGVNPKHISLGVSLAAASRIARFSSFNEVVDWISVLHSFTYANAIHQVVKRVPTALTFRGVYHAALRVYLDRFLNEPPYRIPKGSPGESRDRLLESLLETLNKRYMIDEVGNIVADYLANGYDEHYLIKTLCIAVMREDADFHTVQMLEAGVQLLREISRAEDRKVVLVAMARYIASQSPTQRRLGQIARIALKLHKGEEVYRG